MSEQIDRRLEEVMALIPCPVAGCWFVHGAETAYYYDENCECHVLEVWPKSFDESDLHEGNGHEETEGDILFELAEFDFTELAKGLTAGELPLQPAEAGLRDQLERVWSRLGTTGPHRPKN